MGQGVKSKAGPQGPGALLLIQGSSQVSIPLTSLRDEVLKHSSNLEVLHLCFASESLEGM